MKTELIILLIVISYFVFGLLTEILLKRATELNNEVWSRKLLLVASFLPILNFFMFGVALFILLINWLELNKEE